jgi:hypothetical protein
VLLSSFNTDIGFFFIRRCIFMCSSIIYLFIYFICLFIFFFIFFISLFLYLFIYLLFYLVLQINSLSPPWVILTTKRIQWNARAIFVLLRSVCYTQYAGESQLLKYKKKNVKFTMGKNNLSHLSKMCNSCQFN